MARPTATAIPTSAVFPYGVPPPPPPAFFSSAASNHHRLLSKFKYYLPLILLLVCAAAALSLIYAIIQFYSRNPIHYPEFQLLDPNVTSFNYSAAVDGGVYITGTWNMTLLIRNPNTKTSFSYLTPRAKLWYDTYDDDVASTRVQPLFLDALNETRVGVQFVSENKYLKLNGSDDDVASRIVRDDDEEFGVTVFVKFEIIGYRDMKRRYRYGSVDCYPFKMSVSPNASSKPCVVSHHNIDYNNFD